MSYKCPIDMIMKINDDLPCFGGVPVDVRVSRGRLRCEPPYSNNELEYSEIEGELLGVSKTKWHGFPYWCVALKDELNTYNLLFFLKSAMFIYLLRCLYGRKVKHLALTIGTLSDGTCQMIVEGDNVRLQPAGIELPSIKHIYKRKGDGKRKERHCYKGRLNALQTLVDELGQPSHAHNGKGC